MGSDIKCEIRLARDDDASAVSTVILRALRETNAKDYSSEIIERIAGNFTPAAIRVLFTKHTAFYVATIGTRVIGSASLNGFAIQNVMVSPDVQNKGLGRLLMVSVEGAARDRNITKLTVQSSITAEAFYSRLGFKSVRDHLYGDERTILMERVLSPLQAGTVIGRGVSAG